MNRKLSFLTSLFFAACFVPQLAYAVDVPSRDTAGAEESRFRREEEQTKIDQRLKKEVAQKSEEAEEESQPALGPDAEKVTFLLKEVHFTGNQKISNRELQPFAADYLNRTVNLHDLRKIALRVKRYYRSRGFIAAYASVPPQDVTSGIVEIAIVEGKIGKVEFKGNRWYSTRVLKQALGMGAHQVLFYRDLASGLALLNRYPDIKAKGVLKPGQEPKTTDLEINIKDRFPVHLSTDVDNLGTKNTGITRWGIGVTDNNLLGLMDQASARFQIGKGAWAVGTRYNLPLNSSGTNVSFSYSRSHVRLLNDFEALGVKGDASTYGIDLDQPLIREPDIYSSMNIGFDIKSIENTVLGAKAGKDELRILNTGLNTEFTDAWGKTYFPNSFHFGFADFLGASNKVEPAATRAGTGGQFFIYRSSLVRYNRLPGDMILALRSSLQLTPDTLAPSEQFRLGGAFSVRGYPEGEYMADYGGILSAELMVPTYFFPKDWKLPFSHEPLRNQIQGVGFFDFGAGALRKPLPSENDFRVLSGAGGGLRVHLFDRVFARFQWAGQTGRKSESGAHSAFYYGISAELF